MQEGTISDRGQCQPPGIIARLGKRTDFGGSQDAFLSCQREEFFVGIGKLECRWQVCFNEYGPCIIHFLTFWAFIMILTENFKEETQGIARVVRSQILDLALYEVCELVNDAF